MIVFRKRSGKKPFQAAFLLRFWAVESKPYSTATFSYRDYEALEPMVLFDIPENRFGIKTTLLPPLYAFITV